jgi:hypothetical protein
MLPTVFRGCMWDDHWEFDAPCVVYFPRRNTRFAIGSNTGCIDQITEDICFDLSTNPSVMRTSDGGWEKERNWRGWGDRPERRKGWHVEIRVQWKRVDGDLCAHVVSRKEQFGPFKK